MGFSKVQERCFELQYLLRWRKSRFGVHASLSEKGGYHSRRPPTPLLDTINYPIHMKNLSTKVKVSNLLFVLLYSSVDRKHIFLGRNGGANSRESAPLGDPYIKHLRFSELGKGEFFAPSVWAQTRCLSSQELKQLADELRSDVIFNVSKTGGHLGSSLGVVELTVALHFVFNAPQDRILWDVGHQVPILLRIFLFQYFLP